MGTVKSISITFIFYFRTVCYIITYTVCPVFRNQPKKIIKVVSYREWSLSAGCMRLIQEEVLYQNSGLLKQRIALVFPKQQILDFSKLKESADDNFEFDENGRKVSKRVENTIRKEEISCYKQFFHFPQCFQKTCTEDT